MYQFLVPANTEWNIHDLFLHRAMASCAKRHIELVHVHTLCSTFGMLALFASEFTPPNCRISMDHGYGSFIQRTRDGLWKCMLFFTPFVPRHWWRLKPASVPITRFGVGIDTNVEWLDEVNPCQINCIQRLIFDCKFLHMPFGGEIFFSLREMLVDHYHQPSDEMAYYSAALDAGGDSSNWPRLTHTQITGTGNPC